MDIMTNGNEEYLVVANSNKYISSSTTISLYTINSKFQLEKRAEPYDISNYISFLTVVKNGIFLGDMYNGMLMLVYRLDVWQL